MPRQAPAWLDVFDDNLEVLLHRCASPLPPALSVHSLTIQGSDRHARCVAASKAIACAAPELILANLSAADSIHGAPKCAGPSRSSRDPQRCARWLGALAGCCL